MRGCGLKITIKDIIIKPVNIVFIIFKFSWKPQGTASKTCSRS